MDRIIEGQWIDIPDLGLVRFLKRCDSHNRDVGKVLLPDGSIQIGKFITLPNTHILRARYELSRYHGDLSRAGVSVVEEIKIFVKPVSSTYSQLIQIERHIGPTLQSLLSDRTKSHQEILGLVEKTLNSCYLGLSQKVRVIPDNPVRLGLGIDLLSRNELVCEQTGKIIHGDLWPVKLIRECGSHGVEWPEPENKRVRELAIFRGYNLAGILIGFWCNITILRPALGKKFFYLIKNYLKKHQQGYVLNEVQNYFTALPIRVARLDGYDILNLIVEWGFDDIFRLRALACYLACSVKEGEKEQCIRKILGQIFDLTHFQSEEINSNQIEDAKLAIIEIVDILFGHKQYKPTSDQS